MTGPCGEQALRGHPQAEPTARAKAQRHGGQVCLRGSVGSEAGSGAVSAGEVGGPSAAGTAVHLN